MFLVLFIAFVGVVFLLVLMLFKFLVLFFLLLLMLLFLLMLMLLFLLLLSLWMCHKKDCRIVRISRRQSFSPRLCLYEPDVAQLEIIYFCLSDIK